MQRIGVVGLGLMGSAIVQRLRAAGFEVTGYDVDADKRARLAQLGAAPADSLAALREQCTTIMLAVFNTDQVEAVIEGPDGLLSSQAPAKSRPIFICTSTCDPDRIAQLAARIDSRADYIEMPVSGTSAQVAAGDGVGLVGGARSAVEAATPVLETICPSRQYLGVVGNGGKAKLAVNLVLGLNRGAIAEGLVFAEKMGLEPVAFLEVLRNSAAYSQVMDTKGPLMARREFLNPGKPRRPELQGLFADARLFGDIGPATAFRASVCGTAARLHRAGRGAMGQCRDPGGDRAPRRRVSARCSRDK